MAVNTSHVTMATTGESSEVAKRLDFGDDPGVFAEAQEMNLDTASEKLVDIERYLMSLCRPSNMRLTRSRTLLTGFWNSYADRRWWATCRPTLPSTTFLRYGVQVLNSDCRSLEENIIQRKIIPSESVKTHASAAADLDPPTCRWMVS